MRRGLALKTIARPLAVVVSFSRTLAFGGACLLLLEGAALATPHGQYHGPRWAPPPPRERNDVAMGVQLDLFPTVGSAVNGKVGYAPQVWAGVRPVRLRLVAAHLELPDSFTFDDAVVEPELSSVAAIIDYTFGDHFDGPWLGAGFESWHQAVSAADGSGSAEWQSQVFTVGGGYIFRFADTFTLDPWLGLHTVMNAGPHDVGDAVYDPARFVVSGSVKVGWFFWAR